MDLPSLLRQSVVEKVAEWRRREIGFSFQVRHPFEELLRNFRTSLEQFFLRHFLLSVNPKTKQPVWDLVTARRARMEETLVAPLIREWGEIEESIEKDAEDELEATFLLGVDYGLWELSLGGVRTDSFTLPTSTKVLLAAAALAGLSWRERMRGWEALYQRKVRSALKGSLAVGSTLAETLGTLDVLGKGYLRHVEILARNEWFRHAVQGEVHTFRHFSEEIGAGWLWITADDEQVCERCAPLHLTITTLVPVDDTHPDCRCIVVPVPEHYIPTPSTFAAFTTRSAS